MNILEQERERREKKASEIREHEERERAARQERLLLKMVAVDEEWQMKTNRLHRVSEGLPPKVSNLTALAERQAGGQEYGKAAESYLAASKCTGGRSREILDNLAVCYLFRSQDEDCVSACTSCITIDSRFVYAYLHRARAYRCLQKYDLALKDLETAGTLSPMFAPDTSREAQLILLEKQNAGLRSVQDVKETLGVAEDSSDDDVIAAFRKLAMRWHPDRWIHASQEERAEAACQFQAANEAYETLMDLEKKERWEKAFFKSQAICTPPHLRKSVKKLTCTPHQYSGTMGGSATETTTLDDMMYQNREERMKKERERGEAERKELEEQREKLFFKMIQADQEWQMKTNRIHHVPDAPPDGFLARAEAEADKESWVKAAELYLAASRSPGRWLREILDNLAICYLFTSQEQNCIVVCTDCIKVDTKFMYPYLHRARAYRSLQKYDLALKDLQAAMALGTMFTPDMSREAQLVVRDQENRCAGLSLPRDITEDLGVDDSATNSDILAAFRKLAMQWHPDRWSHASEAEQKKASQQFQAVNEAYSILIDAEKRAAWEKEFTKAEAICKPPHLRKRRGSSAKEPESTAKAARWGNTEAPLEKSSSMEDALEEERKRRQRKKQEDKAKYNQELEEHREKLLLKMIACDEEWQLKTNRLHRIPENLPQEVMEVVSLVAADLEAEDYCKAAKHFEQALRLPGAWCKELLDDHAICLLFALQNDECIVACTNCIRVDSKFIYPYLHRARAYRCLHKYDLALKDLQAAISLGTMFTPDVSREAQLVAMEQQNRLQGHASMADLKDFLGVSAESTSDAVAAAFRELAMRWHPDKWVGASAQQQAEAANQFQACNEAYETLRDVDKRAVWEREFAKNQSICKPVHARKHMRGSLKLCAKSITEAANGSFGVKNTSFGKNSSFGKSDEISPDVRGRVNEERQKRREQYQQQQQQEQSKLEKRRERLLLKMIDVDEKWQMRTNQLHHIPEGLPEDVSRLTSMGASEAESQNYAKAAEYYSLAAQRPGGWHTHILDNLALCYLFDSKDEQCITACTNCIKLDPKFMYAYLHRARGYRCLGRYQLALKDLQMAMTTNTMFTPDMSREAQLVVLEQQNRKGGLSDIKDIKETLGVDDEASTESVAAAFRQQVMQWHPDKWVRATLEEQREAQRQFQAINEAHETLMDAEKRDVWEKEFFRRQTICKPPHLRKHLRTRGESVTSRNGFTRGDSGGSIDEDEDEGCPDGAKRTASFEEKMEQQRKKRKAGEQAKREQEREEKQELMEKRERLLFKMIGIDEDWQNKTNRLHRVPEHLPQPVLNLVNLAGESIEKNDYAKAADYYLAAVQSPGGTCRETLDNLAICHLFNSNDEECIAACTRCIALDHRFIYPYLHRARANRCLRNYNLALEDLQAVMGFGTMFTPDVSREAQLVALEKQNVDAGMTSMQDIKETLGVDQDSEPQNIAAAFRQLAMQWHPDRWVGSSQEEQKEAAQQFQAVNEAYETLMDVEKRELWEKEFFRRQSICRPPHLRQGNIHYHHSDKSRRRGGSHAEPSTPTRSSSTPGRAPNTPTQAHTPTQPKPPTSSMTPRTPSTPKAHTPLAKTPSTTTQTPTLTPLASTNPASAPTQAPLQPPKAAVPISPHIVVPASTSKAGTVPASPSAFIPTSAPKAGIASVPTSPSAFIPTSVPKAGTASIPASPSAFVTASAPPKPVAEGSIKATTAPTPKSEPKWTRLNFMDDHPKHGAAPKTEPKPNPTSQLPSGSTSQSMPTHHAAQKTESKSTPAFQTPSTSTPLSKPLSKPLSIPLSKLTPASQAPSTTTPRVTPRVTPLSTPLSKSTPASQAPSTSTPHSLLAQKTQLSSTPASPSTSIPLPTPLSNSIPASPSTFKPLVNSTPASQPPSIPIIHVAQKAEPNSTPDSQLPSSSTYSSMFASVGLGLQSMVNYVRSISPAKQPASDPESQSTPDSATKSTSKFTTTSTLSATSQPTSNSVANLPSQSTSTNTSTSKFTTTSTSSATSQPMSSPGHKRLELRRAPPIQTQTQTEINSGRGHDPLSGSIGGLDSSGKYTSWPINIASTPKSNSVSSNGTPLSSSQWGRSGQWSVNDSTEILTRCMPHASHTTPMKNELAPPTPQTRATSIGAGPGEGNHVRAPQTYLNTRTTPISNHTTTTPASSAPTHTTSISSHTTTHVSSTRTHTIPTSNHATAENYPRVSGYASSQNNRVNRTSISAHPSSENSNNVNRATVSGYGSSESNKVPAHSTGSDQNPSGRRIHTTPVYSNMNGSAPSAQASERTATPAYRVGAAGVASSQTRPHMISMGDGPPVCYPESGSESGSPQYTPTAGLNDAPARRTSLPHPASRSESTLGHSYGVGNGYTRAVVAGSTLNSGTAPANTRTVPGVPLAPQHNSSGQSQAIYTRTVVASGSKPNTTSYAANVRTVVDDGSTAKSGNPSANVRTAVAGSCAVNSGNYSNARTIIAGSSSLSVERERREAMMREMNSWNPSALRS